ncbi:MAG: HEPN domain-containing protein [Calditrichaeota bacterium]|nr:HEPN domain-containing protein [Calditrichota bacterium]
MRSITQEWIDRAFEDLQTIHEIIGNDLLTNIVAFHAQQAVEKSLKAIMEEYEMSFIKTHSLETLYKNVQSKAHLTFDIDVLQRMDQLYISSRYPGDTGLLPDGKPDKTEAETFAAFAQDIYNQVSTFLSNS